jgi:hypothetical protein
MFVRFVNSDQSRIGGLNSAWTEESIVTAHGTRNDEMGP